MKTFLLSLLKNVVKSPKTSISAIVVLITGVFAMLKNGFDVDIFTALLTIIVTILFISPDKVDEKEIKELKEKIKEHKKD